MNWYNQVKSKQDSKPIEHNVDIQKSAKIEHFLTKQASMTVYVKGFDYPEKINTILDLCWYLLRRVDGPVKENLTPEEFDSWKKKGGYGPEFFSPDGNDYDKPIGIVNNYVSGFPSNKMSFLVNFVRQTLKEANVKVTDIRQEAFPESDEIRVVRYSVGLNPNANERRDEPDEVNFSNSNAGLVIKALGYEGDISNGYDFQASEVVSKIKELDIDNNFWHRVVELQEMGYQFDSGGLQQRLNSVRKVAQWAVDHDYQEIYIV